LGGEVGATSAPGAGSTFWFTARLATTATRDAEASLPATREDAETLLARDHQGRRVLLAEDDPVNQEVAIELLRDTGLIIDVADNGLQAVEMARLTDYDLILMDMQMPKMGGIEATRLIRQVPGREVTPILAMTANAFAEDRQKCVQAGMDDFLPKPVVPKVLYATIYKWLSRLQET
jgi:CheY-like chemotaxis protein